MRKTDAELVRAAQTGDAAAFGELARRYQGLIHGLAYHRLSSFSDAPDVAQNAFIQAFRHLDHLAEPKLFAHWLKRIAVNECKMWLRARNQEISLSEMEPDRLQAAPALEKWRSSQILHYGLDAQRRHVGCHSWDSPSSDL